MASRATKESAPPQLARELKDLITALDRRVPHVERAGEASIARDAAALRAKAMKRLTELEAEAASALSAPTRFRYKHESR